MFLEATNKAEWKKRSEIQATELAFPNCGDWLKAQISPNEANRLLDRMALPCIANYVESFPRIKSRHISFSYYSYGAGDCLSTHDDTDEDYTKLDIQLGNESPPQRRIAAVS